MTTPDASPETLRPNKRVFLWRPLMQALFFGYSLAVAGHLFVPLFWPIINPGLIVWLAGATLLLILVGVDRVVTYSKTFYDFYDDRLVVRTGSLLSRSTIDLPYRNVTQVVLRLPFLEQRFFGTGHLMIHAAGSSQGMARLRSVDAPEELYDEIAERLRKNGFSLARDRKLQREKPHLVGTFLDTSGVAFGALIALFTFSFAIGGAVIDLLEMENFYELFELVTGSLEADDPDDAAVALRGALGLAAVGVLAATFGLARLVIHFIDLNRRTYTLWDDVVDYEDGFLTETYKFIPVENLADTATVEPFLKRLFGMADVHLSPHGAASGIRFPSMPNAARFRANLDRLIEASSQPLAAEPPSADGQDRGSPDEAGEEREKSVGGARDRLPEVDAAPISFGPSIVRRLTGAVVGSLKLPVVVLIGLAIAYVLITGGFTEVEELELPLEEIPWNWIVLGTVGLAALSASYKSIKAVFYCKTTHYRIGRRKVAWERDFISRDEFEFTNDKISTVLVERDLLDRLMGSATISFRSIGNNTPLVFEDVARASQKIQELRQRLGIGPRDDDPGELRRPRISGIDFFWEHLGSLFFYAFCAAGAVIASQFWPYAFYLIYLFAALAVMMMVRDLLYYPRSRLRLHDKYLHLRQGIIFLEDYFLPYDQVRSVSSTRYPFRSRGCLRVVPGGGRRLTLRYLPDLQAVHDEIDHRLYHHPMRPVSQAPEFALNELARYRPVARNKIVAVGLVTAGITLFTVLPSLLMWIGARRTSIIVEGGRIRRLRGIFYRATQTVLFNRVDQILTRQGPTHTIFKNGVVHILTVGSTLPDLALGPLSSYQELYERLEELS